MNIKNVNSYSDVASAYAGSSFKGYWRIELPTNVANIWTMMYLEISLFQWYVDGSIGKIIVGGFHRANTDIAWDQFTYTLIGNLDEGIIVYGSDGRYIYIKSSSTYESISINKIMLGDTAASVDASDITISDQSSLPSTYQTATYKKSLKWTNTYSISTSNPGSQYFWFNTGTRV